MTKPSTCRTLRELLRVPVWSLHWRSVKFSVRKFCINWMPQVHLNQHWLWSCIWQQLEGFFSEVVNSQPRAAEHQAWIWVTDQRTFCISPKHFGFFPCLLILSFCFLLFSNTDRKLNNWKMLPFAIFTQLLKWQCSSKVLLLYFLSEGIILFHFLGRQFIVTEEWKYEIFLWVTA